MSHVLSVCYAMPKAIIGPRLDEFGEVGLWVEGQNTPDSNGIRRFGMDIYEATEKRRTIRSFR